MKTLTRKYLHRVLAAVALASLLTAGVMIARTAWRRHQEPEDVRRYRAQLERAAAALFEARDRDEAAAVLDDAPSIRRGWEWHALRRLSQGKSKVVALGPLDANARGVIGFEGRLAAVVYNPGQTGSRVAVYDLRTGQAVLRLLEEAKEKQRVDDLALSGDGRTLVLARAKVSEVQRQRRLEVVGGMPAGIRHLPQLRNLPAFQPRVREVNEDVEVQLEGFLLRLDVRGGGMDHGQPEGGAEQVVLGPNGRYLAYRSGTNVVVEAGREGSRSLSGVTAFAFSADGKRLATGASSGEVSIIDLSFDHALEKKSDGRRPPIELSAGGKVGAVHQVVFSADGRRLAALGKVGVGIWDLATNKQVGSTPGQAIVGAFTPDGRLLVARDNGVIAVVDCNGGRVLCSLPGLIDAVSDLACLHDGTLRILGKSGMDLVCSSLDLNQPVEDRRSPTGGARAIDELTRAIDRPGRDARSQARLLHRRGLLRAEAGDVAGGKGDLDQAFQLDPDVEGEPP